MPEQKTDLLQGQTVRLRAGGTSRRAAPRRSGGRGSCRRAPGRDTVACGYGLEQGVGIRRLRDGWLQRGERAGGAVQVDGRVHKVGIGHDAVEQALELADVVRYAVGEQASDVERELDALFRGLGLQDRQPGLRVRGLDVRDKSPLEREEQSGLSRPGMELGGRSPATTTWQPLEWRSLKSVKNSSCVRPLSAQELDVVDQEQLRRAVAAPELIAASLGDRRDEVVGELLGGHVESDTVALDRVLGDCLKEVRLAEARGAVYVTGGCSPDLGARRPGRPRRAAMRLLSATTKLLKVISGVEPSRPAAGWRSRAAPR